MQNKQNSTVLKWMLKHFLYLSIVSFLISFALLPMHGMMKLNTIRNILSTWPESEPLRPYYIYSYTLDVSRNFLFYPLNLEVTCLAFGGIGFGSALILFGHLFSRKQHMMYAGLPITRSRDFLLRTACFCILAVLPVLICSLCYPLLVYITGMGKYFDTGLYLKEAVVINLTVLYGYALGVLSAQIFGTLWAAVLGGIVLAGSAEAIYGCWYSITCWYLHTMRPEKAVHQMANWSPLVSLYKGLYQADHFHWLPAPAAILLFLLLAWRLSLRNRPERAGVTLNYARIEKPGQAWIAILGGSVGGWILARMTEPEISLYLGIVLGTAGLSLAARMLKEQNIRVDREGWGLPVICLAGMLLCCLGLRLDLFGYDSYLPEMKDVQAMSFGQAYYEETQEEETVRFAEPKNLEAAYQWATLLRNQSVETRKKAPYQRYPDIGLRIRWETNGGARFTRQYAVLEDQQSAKTFIQIMADSNEYRSQRAENIPVYKEIHGSGTVGLNMNLQGEDFRDVFGFSPLVNWERIKGDPVREALAEDIKERTWEEMQGLVAGQCWIYETDEKTGAYRTSGSYPIYTSDERTIRQIWGNQADQVLEYLQGGWADNDEVLVFRCEYDDSEDGRILRNYISASSPDEAREWVGRTTQCDNMIFRAPTDPEISILIYTKTGVRRWAENNDMEEILGDPGLWEHLPEWEEIYTYTNLRMRSDK